MKLRTGETKVAAILIRSLIIKKRKRGNSTNSVKLFLEVPAAQVSFEGQLQGRRTRGTGWTVPINPWELLKEATHWVPGYKRNFPLD